MKRRYVTGNYDIGGKQFKVSMDGRGRLTVEAADKNYQPIETVFDAVHPTFNETHINELVAFWAIKDAFDNATPYQKPDKKRGK